MDWGCSETSVRHPLPEFLASEFISHSYKIHRSACVCVCVCVCVSAPPRRVLCSTLSDWFQSSARGDNLICRGEHGRLLGESLPGLEPRGVRFSTAGEWARAGHTAQGGRGALYKGGRRRPRGPLEAGGVCATSLRSRAHHALTTSILQSLGTR